MVAVVTVLLALPLGYLVRSPVAAYGVYALAYMWAFVYQSVYLVLGRIDGDQSAFGRGEFPWSYGLVTLGVYLVGFGLVTLGRRLRQRRTRARQAATA